MKTLGMLGRVKTLKWLKRLDWDAQENNAGNRARSNSFNFSTFLTA
jgi:hypothetical protein